MKLSLRASHIGKAYSGNEVLRDCSFSFGHPGIYVLAGPNGSGKSTFLRLCALLEHPDKGEIVYLEKGNPVYADIALKRRITLLLPGVGLFNATVFSNVAYGLRIRKLTVGEVKDRVDKVLEFVGLQHKRGQNALTLSSGEAKRLGIARAIAIEPEVLFLDEPTASVDEKNTVIIENIIQQMKHDQKTIIVMTTHDRSQAVRFADQSMVMKDGKILLL